jgi:hypothetical protein
MTDIAIIGTGALGRRGFESSHAAMAEPLPIETLGDAAAAASSYNSLHVA